MRYSLLFLLFSYLFTGNCQITPTLVYPTNNIVLHDSIVNFEWNSDYSYLNQNIQISSDSNFTSIIIDDSTLHFPVYSSSILNFNTFYFWRIRGKHNNSHSVWSDSRKFIITTPKSLDSLQFWLDATQINNYNDSDSISIIYDIGPDSFPLTQTDPVRQPLFKQNVINLLPSMYFDGNDDGLRGGDILNRNGPYSYFAIAKLLSPVNYCTVFSKARGNWDGNISLGANSNTDKIILYSDSLTVYDNFTRFGNNFCLVSFNAKPDSVYSYYNNTNFYTTYNTSDLSGTNPIQFEVGEANNNQSYHWYGYISEIIINNDSLPDSTIKFYNKYLMDKYAPPICLGKDTSTCNTSLLINAYNNCYKSYLWQDSSTDSVFMATSSGYYYVEVIDVFGRHSSDTIYVNLDTSSFTVNLISDTTLCQGNNLFFNAGPSHLDYTWSNGITTPYLITDTSGTFYVTVTDCKSNISTDSIHITFNNYNHSFNIDTILCFFDTLNLNPGFSPNLIYNWSTGDTTSFINTWDTGNYSVIISDTFGCKFYSDTVFVKVDSFPQTTTLGNDTSLCTGVNITLLSGNSSATSYLWSTGDTTQYITISSPDNYSIIVTDTLGCIAKDTVQITIHGQAPIPNFTWQNICLGDNTQFADSSYTTDNSNIISWQWQLPDTLLTTQNIAYTFSDTGSFPVILVINTDSNCSNTIQKQVNIHPLPEINFSYGLNCNNTDIPFTNLVNSIDSIQTFFWNFGDSTSDTLANTTHNYSQTGNYNVSLLAVSIYGCMDSISKNIEIKPSPDVDFSYTNTCSDKPTSFLNLTTTVSPVYSIINWLWNFGDGTTSANNNPTHNFNLAGIYPVSLYAQSINGCSQTKYDTIEIYQTPTALYSYDSICENTTQLFLDNSYVNNDTIISWNWFIEESIQSTEQNPTFYFPTSGNNKVILTVQTSHQCTDDYSENIYIYPSPVVDFTYYPEVGTTTTEITFSTDSGYTYLWDFGDSYTATDSISYHTYSDTGTFYIELCVTNEFGCTDTVNKSIMVVIPLYDVEIYNFTYSKVSNYLSFDCQFLNAGPLPLDSLVLTLQINNATNFTEYWSGHLLPGQIGTHHFSTLLPIVDNKLPEYVCLQIDIPEKTDVTPENNLKCIDADNNFILYTVYPNPAENFLYVEFNLDEEIPLTFQVFDKLGKTIFTESKNNLKKGFNRIKLNTSSLSSGTYTIRILKKSDSVEKQFMVK